MNSPSPSPTGRTPDEFPNPSCRAVQIPSIANFAYCMSEMPNICPHSLYFGKLFLCRHADCLVIAKRTQKESI